jgi:hypothetical protein
MSHEKYVIDGKHFHLLPIDKTAIEAFVTSISTKTAMSVEEALKLLTHPGMKDAIIDAAKAYATHPAHTQVAQPPENDIIPRLEK